MKKILRWMYGLLGLGICAAVAVLLFNMGLIGGFSASLPEIEYVQGLPVGEEIPCGKKTSDEFELIAQDGEVSLYFRAENANFCVETASGERWYAFPPEGADDWARGVFKTEMVSSLIINYIDLENKENVKKNSQAASVKKDTFTVRKIENGFRTDYYFKDGDATIPVEVFLKDGCLEVRILTGEIVEAQKERYILSSVRLLPYFGCAAESDEGYVFVPDGQGALMHVNNGKGNMQEYRAAVYGENASATRMFSAADAYAASLPVFGVKRNDAAFLAVITAGENAAYINAMPAFRDTSYTNVWAEYKLRYTDSYMLDASSNLGQTITLYQDEAIEAAACQQRYYFLEGETADYNGMADCYRSYLLAECGVTEQPADDTVLFVDFAAAVTRKESLLGVPVNRVRQLSSLTDIQTMYEGLCAEVTGGIRLRIGEWSKDAVKDKLDTRFQWAAGNSWTGWNELQSAVTAQGDTVSLTVDPVSYRKGGSGIIPIRDSAMSLSGSPAFQYEFKFGTRMRNGEKRGYLLHPALLETYAAKAMAALDQQDVQSLSPLTLPDTRYGSYSKNRAYPGQTQQAAEAVLAMLAEEYSLVLERPNAFALPYADFVTDVPGDFSRYDVLDETVPFLQMVYSGLTGYAGETVNLSADPDSAVLHAIATGEALHYELITGDAELLIDTDLNTLFSARPELWLPHMKEAAAQVAQAREATENTRLTHFEWLSAGVSVSTFENGAVICVNDTNEAIAWQGQSIPAGTWLAGKEDAE